MNDILRFQVTRSVDRRVADRLSAAIALDFPVPGDPIMFLDDLCTAEQQKAMFATLRAEQQQTMQQCVVMLTTFANMSTPKERLQTLASQWFGTTSAVPNPLEQPLTSALDDIDTWLCAAGDSPSTDKWTRKLILLAEPTLPTPTDAASAAKALVVSADWLLDRLRLGLSLLASLYLPDGDANTQAIRARTSRLVSVAALIEDIARGLLSVQNPARLRQLLGTRRIILPGPMLRPLKKPSNLARKPGMADLYVVRQTWWKYVPGEVAHIESVMAHEAKKRFFERRDSTEALSQDQVTATTSDERENQSTSRFELTEALREASSSNWYVNGAINVTAEMPQTVISANAGAGFDQSSERSKETARTETNEILSRAITKVERSVSQLRSTRSHVQIIDRTKHVIDNKDGEAGNAIYRWVDKVNAVELWKYPHRFLIDMQVPEPAAWLRHVMEAKHKADTALPPEPPAFPNNLDMEGITADGSLPLYYMALAQTFATEVPPPPATRVMAVAFADPTKATTTDALPGNAFESKETLSVPEGYVATTWNAVLRAQGKPSGAGFHDPVVWVAVGNGAAQRGGPMIADPLSGTVGSISEGTIPVTVQGNLASFFAVHVLVTCEPSAELMTRWRFDVYNALRAAQERRHRQWEEQVAAQAASGELHIDGRSPLRNRELVRAELKRLSIELMTGQRFVGPGGMRPPAQGWPPEMDIDIARDNAARIQFVEQAFEWSNLSYVPYPHYWAENGRWPELALIESEDPEFATFMRSGSARVIVSARPGFEAQVQLFLDYGLIWGGGPVPGPNSADYVSVAEEIREMYHGPRDGELVEKWDVRLPTSLIYIDAQNTIPLVNPDIVAP